MTSDGVAPRRLESRSWPLVVGVIVLIAVIGALQAPLPFSGDAALYQSGARAMESGQVLFRDFWDLKQPGIYLVHLIAGRLFGFDEVGLRLAELLLLLGLSGALVHVLRRSFEPRWIVAVVPLASVGTYYVVASEWHLTQPAVLVSVPLFALLALVSGARAGAWRWLVAGVVGALALSFGLYVGAVVIAIAIAALILTRLVDRNAISAILLKGAGPFALGFLVVVVAELTWLSSRGAMDVFLWTHSGWRDLAIDVRGRFALGHAVYSAFWFGRSFWPWLVLIPFAGFGWRGLAQERIFVLAFVWLIVGGVATAVEPFAAWEFDYLKLMVPTAMLAARGLHGLLSRGERAALTSRRLLAAAAGLLLLTSMAPLREKDQLIRKYAGSGYGGAGTLRSGLSARYGAAWRSTAFLRDSASRPGEIYVFGNPLIHLLSDRPHASAIHGWAWELQPTSMWEALERDLQERQPPFVFVAADYERLIEERAAGVRMLLDSAYSIRSEEPGGRWYERR